MHHSRGLLWPLIQASRRAHLLDDVAVWRGNFSDFLSEEAG